MNFVCNMQFCQIPDTKCPCKMRSDFIVVSINLLWFRFWMESKVLSDVLLSVYIISFLIGLPANLLALYAFSVKIHSKPLPTDILLLNLTVSDLLFLITLPLKPLWVIWWQVWCICKFQILIFYGKFSIFFTGSDILYTRVT